MNKFVSLILIFTEISFWKSWMRLILNWNHENKMEKLSENAVLKEFFVKKNLHIKRRKSLVDWNFFKF